MSMGISNMFIVENVFSEIDKLINLMYCESISHDDYCKFDNNVYTALKDYYREEIINHFDKIANAYNEKEVIKED